MNTFKTNCAVELYWEPWADSEERLPQYATPGSSGLDLRAQVPEGVLEIPKGEIRNISLGFRLEIPEGLEGQIRARSGLAKNHRICLANGIGTIDSDYRGEVSVLLLNLGQQEFTVCHGLKVAQLVFVPVFHAILLETNTLSKTERGNSGFGSTGMF